MNLGRLTTALFLATVIASALVGCGSQDTSSSAATADSSSFATPATGSAGGGAKDKSNVKSTFSAPKASKSDASAGASAKAPVELSKSDTKQVKLALSQMMQALSKDDVAYLCGTAYSNEFLAQLASKGGCEKSLKADLSSVNAFSAKVQQMVWIQKNLVAASVVLKRDTSAKLQSNPATLYFMKQAGAWKRTVPPAT